jgi:hypothetical protein
MVSSIYWRADELKELDLLCKLNNKGHASIMKSVWAEWKYFRNITNNPPEKLLEV